MRYLLLSSIVFLFAACSSAYKGLQVADGDPSCLQKFKPVFTSSLYNTHVNVIGKHLSGLLLIKTMPDSSVRIVFSSEMGVKFFDFEFYKNGEFKVHSIIKQMDKKGVVNTLRKDFELVLMRDLDKKKPEIFMAEGLRWFAFEGVKEKDYYITDSLCQQLVRIEKGSNRKYKLKMVMKDYVNGVPDTIGITHRKFNFNIGLKYINR
jgi:hypothetical protein